jgi:hypothetical protein
VNGRRLYWVRTTNTLLNGITLLEIGLSLLARLNYYVVTDETAKTLHWNLLKGRRCF